MTDALNLLDVCRRFLGNVKHSTRLGMTVEAADAEGVKVSLPWRADLVGNPETGVLHGGALFAFMDMAGGLANTCATFPVFEITPTIDMRVDHLRAPAKGATILCEASCYRMSQQVMFVRMTVYEEGNPEQPVATGLATYMRMKLPTGSTVEHYHAKTGDNTRGEQA